MTRRKGKTPGVKPRSRGIGPYTSESRLSRVDIRTAEGRFARALEQEFSHDLGGDPSTAQRMLIQVAVFKSLRLALLTKAFDDLEKTGYDEKLLNDWVIRYSNSLREDLKALGLQRITKPPEDLEAFLIAKPDKK